jgi:hypothetical protein
MNDQATATPFSEVILEVAFSVDQLGSDLRHTLARVTPDAPDPQPDSGVHAESLYFAPGEQVRFKVTGRGAVGNRSAADAFVSFQIIDCVLITRPRVIQMAAGLPTLYAAPSPFLQATGASYPLALDFAPTASGLLPDGVRTVTQQWKHSLNVGFNPGLWELSLVLTVRIMRGAGAITEMRVFSFDPEAEVGGNGTLKAPH